MKRIFSMIVGLAVALSALQAQNFISVSDIDFQQGDVAVVSVELTNDMEFSAFQMDLRLPDGFAVATTINEDGEEVLDFSLGEERKKSTHSLSYNVLSNGAIRIASFSSKNATYKGVSGEILQFKVVAVDSLEPNDYLAELYNVLFTTPDAEDVALESVAFKLLYGITSPEVPVNEILANTLYLEGEDDSALLSVELVNVTEFSAFQMDLLLPEGFTVATTIDEDGEEVLDIALGDERKKSSHSLSYNLLSNGSIRVASFSNTNAVFRGTSGTIVQFRIVAMEAVAEGTYFAKLNNVVFTTPDAVDYNLPGVTIQIDYLLSQGGDVEPVGHNVEVHSSPYGRCICDGYLIEPSNSDVISGFVEHGYELKLYFVPFEGYVASSMKRNGEVIVIHNNVYEENVTEDVAFTDVNYVTIVDTLVVTETVVDTLVQTETIVDTLVVTETVVDTLVQTETIVDTLVVTEIVVDTLVLTETIVDTMLVEVVDTVFFETIDTIFVPEYEALPIPVITCDSGVVTITCSSADVAILYAINGDPMEGSIYTGPFEAPTDAVISAVAVKRGEMAVLNLAGEGVEQTQMRVISRRYYNDSGVAVTSPEEGITIVVAEYEDGSTRVYKMVKR